MYVMLGRGGSGAPPPPTQAPPPLESEGDEEEDGPLNLYGFLEELSAEQAGKVPPVELHTAIATTFKTQRQVGNARAADR
jgi:hypothetical protein